MLRSKLLAAAQAVKDQCESIVGGSNIPAEDMVVLEKYLEKGYIKLTSKKPHLGRELYLPMMAHPALKGLTMATWLTLILHYMPKYGLKGGPTKGSGASYYHGFAEYAFKYDIKAIRGLPLDTPLESVMTVVSNHLMGPLMSADEEGQLKELLEDNLLP